MASITDGLTKSDVDAMLSLSRSHRLNVLRHHLYGALVDLRVNHGIILPGDPGTIAVHLITKITLLARDARACSFSNFTTATNMAEIFQKATQSTDVVVWDTLSNAVRLSLLQLCKESMK